MNTRDVFGRETVPVVTAAEAAAHDRAAQDVFGIPEPVLMENAGRSLALITQTLFPSGKIVGVAGGGHNGGDTVVALRTLQSWGRDVVLVRAGKHEVDRALLHGATLPEACGNEIAFALGSASVVLDGILGTGARGAPRAESAQFIRAINAADKPVIAVDLPSGVDPDTSQIYDDAIDAKFTVTFGFPKLGLLFHPARALCGRLIAVEIGFPPLEGFKAQLVTPEWAAQRFPQRPANANKGTSGRLLLVVGSTGMAGAAVLAGKAAVHSGAGLVRIVSAADNREIVQKSVPEATFFERGRDVAYDGITAVVAGPGMGANDATRTFLGEVLEQTRGVPTLLDADALNVMAGDANAVAAIAAARPLLITPHPKEMSRLSGKQLAEIAAAPVSHARAFAERTGATVLLKGQPTVVAHPTEPLLINSVGSSDFAVAGMGDQLAGVTGAMLAAGLEPRTAAGVALFYSGRAGDIAQLGRALTPSDVTDHLARAFAQAGLAISSLGHPFITFDQPARR